MGCTFTPSFLKMDKLNKLWINNQIDAKVREAIRSHERQALRTSLLGFAFTVLLTSVITVFVTNMTGN